MRGTGCGENWVLLSKSLINFLMMGGAVFPPCSLASGQTMVGVMATSFKRSYAGIQGLPGLL